MATANYYLDGYARGAADSCSRNGYRAFYLHFILSPNMYILGISALYHDSAAALLKNGLILAAAQEERFSRVKHDAAFPSQAIQFCLKHAGISINDVEHIVFYDKPLLKFERLLESYIAFAPKGFRSFSLSMPIWLREKLFLKSLLQENLCKLGAKKNIADKLLFSEHHLSHAASAYYPSPFNEATVITIDGVGEWTTTSVAVGTGKNLEIKKEIHFPHSLGLLYSAFTYYTGFKVNSGEYKLMGLAPYGEPCYKDLILEHLIDLKEDGSFHLDMSYFDYCTGLTMTSERFHKLFGGPPCVPGQQPTQREMNLAASIQSVIEEAIQRLVYSAIAETGINNICLAGGVALNCVANGKLLKNSIVKNLWVQPAAGDAGGALGAAFAGYHLQLEQERTLVLPDAMQGAFLGPEFSQTEIEERLSAIGAKFKILDSQNIFSECAKALADGKALGWFQGRMEFGPRALGARSILADPRSPAMQSTLNQKIKFRESFRPFAPAVLSEQAFAWFELSQESPYMLVVAEVAVSKRLAQSDAKPLIGIEQLRIQRSSIPAVTHVDYSARVQTVSSEVNPCFHKLISEFYKITECPILVNTSFNVRGEPIVGTPEEAFDCFMETNLDIMAVGNCLLVKNEQNLSLIKNYHNDLPPD